MQKRHERTGVHHEFCGRAVDRAVDIQIEAFAYVDGYGLEPMSIETRHATSRIRVGFQKEETLLTIEHRFGGKKNIGAQNAVDFLFFQHASSSGRTAKIDKHYWLIHQLETTESELAHDTH